VALRSIQPLVWQPAVGHTTSSAHVFEAAACQTHACFTDCQMPCRHLAYLATSIGQLQDAEHGSSAGDDMPDQHTALEQDPAGPRPSPAVSHEQQQQQQAVSEVCRLLLPELCNQVQHCGSLMDAISLSNFVAAMGRLGHYDWQTMRLVGTLAMRQAHVSASVAVAAALHHNQTPAACCCLHTSPCGQPVRWCST
jgi:hypothetical protein